MSTMKLSMSEKNDACPACGIRWIDHLGVTGTCQKLVLTVAALWQARAEIERLRDLVCLVADEPNIDKARALADTKLCVPNVAIEARP